MFVPIPFLVEEATTGESYQLNRVERLIVPRAGLYRWVRHGFRVGSISASFGQEKTINVEDI